MDNNELPKRVEEQNPTPENKPIIEIPQEYYDKLEKERQEKEEAAKVEAQKAEEEQAVNEKSNKIFLGAFLSAIVFLILLYLMVNKNHLFIVGLPIYIIVFAAIKASSEKSESTAPMSILIGGIIAVALAFVGSLVIKAQEDFFKYATTASIALALVGTILASITTNLIAKKGETKALGTIGYLLFYVVLFGGSFFAYKKFPEQVLKYVFNEKNTIVAVTEEEFINKTLKNRYGIDFICDQEFHNYIDEDNNRVKKTTCHDSSGVEFEVTSYEYSVKDVEYIVQDTYVDAKFLSDVKSEIANEVKLLTNANSVSVLIYPEKYCAFVGDCVAETEQYLGNIEEESKTENRYNYSKNLDLKKYMNLSPQEFVNEFGMGYSITLYGSYSGLVDSKYLDTTTSVLNNLNTSGYKNKNGFMITLKQDDEFRQIAYRAMGEKSSDGLFKNPKAQ